ncbi:MAG TPA: hypothetical protein VK559_07850, partial [Ferruginibacter sp.]|nr:hypothetical protein [Ferruginibacter sp.]
MKTISYLIVAIITVSISACSSDPGFNLDIEKNLDRSLVMSTYDLQTQTKSLLKKMDSLPDAQTTYWKNNWQPKAMQAEQISDSISNYIEALKSEVKVQAKVQMPNGAEVYDNIDRDGVRKIFDTEAKGYELYIALK